MITFANPAFLYLGLLLAVPIVIHLMKQQNAINLVFPSISFIIKGKMPREGRRKLRDIILLLIRMLIFSLVILALAGPHFGNSQNNTAETGKTLQTAIILDTSSSMNGWDSMKNAEKIIKEILSSTENSEFELLTSSDKVRVVAEWTTKKNEILEKFRTLKPSLCEGRHENAVAETLKTFRPDVESKICIVSDFQLTDWSFPSISLPMKNLSIDFMECSPGRTENVGIAEAQAVRTLNGSTDIIVKVQNFGILNQTRTLCVRSTSGKIERNITIPPRKTVKTVLPLGKSELESVEISLGNDFYTPDDTFSLWTGPELPLKIAAFAPPERNDELFFLQRAFSSAASTVRQFDYSSLDSKEFKDINLNSLSIIFLVGACADFSDNDYKRLDAFLEKGGTVVVTPGTEPGNSFLGLKNCKLLSADYQGISDRGGIYGFTRISQINPTSPFFLLFEENENTDIKLFPIYRFARLAAKKPAETLISMEDKFPFLLRQSKGPGTLFAFSIDFSMAASEFPVTGSFLPVLHEIVQGGKNRKDSITTIKCGEKAPSEISPTDVAPPSTGTDEKEIFMQPGVFCENRKTPVQVNTSRLESVTEKQTITMLRRKISTSAGKTPQEKLELPKPELDGKTNLAALAATLALLAAMLEIIISFILDKRKTTLPNAEGT